VEYAWKTRARICGASLVLVLASGGAQAGEAEDRAASLFREGVALMDQGRLDAAREKLEKSLAITRKPAVVFNLAQLERTAKRPVQALKLFREYGEIAGPKGAQLEEAQNLMQKAYAETGHIKVTGAEGQELQVDADKYGKLPMSAEIDVTVGTHRVSAGAESRNVACEPGKQLIVNLDKGGGTSTAPATSGTGPVAPGETSYQRTTAGYVVPAVLAGAGLVGIGLGAAFGAGSASKTTEVEAQFNQKVCAIRGTSACQAALEKSDSAKAQQGLSIGMYVVGGVLAAAAIGAWLFWPKDQVTKRAAVRLSPWVGRESQGMTLEGTF
jgi:hypothetical protein